jgi:Amt family ammonium transporter
MVGMLLTGVFASTAVNSAGPDGLFYGNPGFFFTQFKAMGIAVVYSFVVSYGIFKFINLIVPIRVSEMEEELGLDETQHNEKYMQGHLLVQHHNGEMKETPTEKHA